MEKSQISKMNVSHSSYQEEEFDIDKKILEMERQQQQRLTSSRNFTESILAKSLSVIEPPKQSIGINQLSLFNDDFLNKTTEVQNSALQQKFQNIDQRMKLFKSRQNIKPTVQKPVIEHKPIEKPVEQVPIERVVSKKNIQIVELQDDHIQHEIEEVQQEMNLIRSSYSQSSQNPYHQISDPKSSIQSEIAHNSKDSYIELDNSVDLSVSSEPQVRKIPISSPKTVLSQNPHHLFQLDDILQRLPQQKINAAPEINTVKPEPVPLRVNWKDDVVKNVSKESKPTLIQQFDQDHIIEPKIKVKQLETKLLSEEKEDSIDLKIINEMVNSRATQKQKLNENIIQQNSHVQPDRRSQEKNVIQVEKPLYTNIINQQQQAQKETKAAVKITDFLTEETNKPSDKQNKISELQNRFVKQQSKLSFSNTFSQSFFCHQQPQRDDLIRHSSRVKLESSIQNNNELEISSETENQSKLQLKRSVLIKEITNVLEESHNIKRRKNMNNSELSMDDLILNRKLESRIQKKNLKVVKNEEPQLQNEFKTEVRKSRKRIANAVWD
ncbi:Hypothetical_protein [Hexamita inflata]|uniref:Hypothetical_protein n=1 Tax=Hexamita inflata TaxID=28002 RepID=A0AA86NEL7_9EUKA|nr:Hypothetical protein HINF_LOCUS6027 [Hexamita inflata]